MSNGKPFGEALAHNMVGTAVPALAGGGAAILGEAGVDTFLGPVGWALAGRYYVYFII